MNLLEKVRKHGVIGSAGKVLNVGKHRYQLWRVRNAPEYVSPTDSDHARIERDLQALGVAVEDYSPDPAAFQAFTSLRYFPADYHGGVAGGVWDEKLLEHWITSQLLGLPQFRPGDVYVDIAAASSPWVKIVRERMGVEAYAIDMAEIGPAYRDLEYYRVENATKTSFGSASIRGASLHCAYEMFMRNDDVNLLTEAARILKPGGKMVIAPLYMHTHYCAYSTPEYYGKGLSDPEGKEYVRSDCYGVPSSRKYDAKKLYERVLRPIQNLGMSYRLLVLRNKNELGKDIYCHFILEVTR
jgi:hypothetical protein